METTDEATWEQRHEDICAAKLAENKKQRKRECGNTCILSFVGVMCPYF